MGSSDLHLFGLACLFPTPRFAFRKMSHAYVLPPPPKTQVLQQQLPLTVPDLRVREHSPVGHVDVVLSHIVLPNMSVPEAHIDLEPQGSTITIFAAGVTANVSFSWAYRVGAHYWPWPMGDAGTGHIEIEGLQTGVSFRLKQVSPLGTPLVVQQLDI